MGVVLSAAGGRGGFDSTRNAVERRKGDRIPRASRTDRGALCRLRVPGRGESTLGTASSLGTRDRTCRPPRPRYLCPAVSARREAGVLLHPVLNRVVGCRWSEKKFSIPMVPPHVPPDIGVLCTTGGDLAVGSSFLGTVFVRNIDDQRCHGGAESTICPLRKMGYQRAGVPRSGTSDPEAERSSSYRRGGSIRNLRPL